MENYQKLEKIGEGASATPRPHLTVYMVATPPAMGCDGRLSLTPS